MCQKLADHSPFAAYILTGVAVTGIAAVAGIYALTRTTTSSFILRQTIAAPKVNVFASEKDPATYWKFARKGYRPAAEQTMHPDGLGMDYVIRDKFMGSVFETPLKLRWTPAEAEPCSLEFYWTLLSNIKVHTHWKYQSLAPSMTEMEVTQTMTGPRWKVWLFTSPLAQLDFKHRMRGVKRHFESTVKA